MSMGEIKLYDTIKDKDGNRYRVTEVSDSLGVIKAVRIKGEEQVSCGRPRMIKMVDIDGHKYMKVKSIPPVTVTHQEPKPSEKAAEKQKQTVREITKTAHSSEDLKEQNEILPAEILDLKKTISKMRLQHEAEVADLKDRIMEKEAEANAVKKRKDEILAERTQYADALDNDSVAFDEILSLAETIQLVTTASAKLAKQIIAKTEGRI